MRVLYKALASVGMLALSTAAAFGIRHLTVVRKKRREARENDLKNAEAANNSAETADSSNDAADDTANDAVEVSSAEDVNDADHSDDDETATETPAPCVDHCACAGRMADSDSSDEQ